MAQITLYLDSELEAKVKQAAKEANLSQGRWVANVIAEKLSTEWPPSVAALAGTWADETNETIDHSPCQPRELSS